MEKGNGIDTRQCDQSGLCFVTRFYRPSIQLLTEICNQCDQIGRFIGLWATF